MATTKAKAETSDNGTEPASEPTTTLRPVDDQQSSGYVVPIVHARVPEPVVDVAFWASIGVVAAVGVIDLPVAGAIAAGMFVIRRRHHS